MICPIDRTQSHKVLLIDYKEKRILILVVITNENTVNKGDLMTVPVLHTLKYYHSIRY